MFENAKWIVKEYKTDERPAPIFRKTFFVGKSIKKAMLSVCGLGYGVYFINGKKVTDEVLITPFTKYDEKVIYSEFDVTHLVKEGKNALCAICGNGFYNDISKTWNFDTASWRSCPKMIAQLDIIYDDKACETVLTDSSWKTFDSPVLYNHARIGEIYDARLEVEGWNLADFDDSLWQNARVNRGPGGRLKKMEHTPIRVVRTIKMKKISDDIYDAGENISGWAFIRAKGERGREITYRYGETLNEDGSMSQWVQNHFNREEMKPGCVYTMKGDGVEEYEQSFNYNGFRYVRVENAPENFEIFARVVHTDFDIIGDFECSCKTLNKIHEMTRRSTLTNWMGIPTDCPQREQNGWTGDALLSAQQTLMNYDAASCYNEWLDSFKDVQRKNGEIPGIVPTSSWGYEWGNGPAWDSALIQIPWYVYSICSDKSIIENMWDNMELYMDFMYTMSEGYIANYGLGDWCNPYHSKQCSTEITDTAYYYANAVTMAKCARVIGKDSKKYEELSEKVRNAFREKFIRNGNMIEENQTSVACAIYQGLLNEDEEKKAAKRLATLVEENGYRIDCGILGTKYIFTALSKHGYASHLYKMVTNPKMPSYKYWIDKGLTTLAENWYLYNKKRYKDPSLKEEWDSFNHHMFSEVDMWFYKHLAGIAISDEGVVINPCFIDELSYVKAHHRGISVYWDKEKVKITTDRDGIAIINDKKYILTKGKYEFNIK